MLFKIPSKIYSYKTRELIVSVIRAIRSKWLQPQFKACGKTTRFEEIGFLHGVERITVGSGCYFTS